MNGKTARTIRYCARLLGLRPAVLKRAHARLDHRARGASLARMVTMLNDASARADGVQRLREDLTTT